MNLCHEDEKIILDLNYITKTQKNFDSEVEQVLFQSTIRDLKKEVLAGYKDGCITVKEELDVSHILYPAKGFWTIIYNLLSNDVNYKSPERPAEIKIKTFLENGSVVLTVEDNGLGIERYQLPKMFGMFQRFHSHVEGTGIGLYIIKRIVGYRGGGSSLSARLIRGASLRYILKYFWTKWNCPALSYIRLTK